MGQIELGKIFLWEKKKRTVFVLRGRAGGGGERERERENVQVL